MSNPWPESNSSYWEQRCEKAEATIAKLEEALRAAGDFWHEWDTGARMCLCSPNDPCGLCDKAHALYEALPTERLGPKDE